VERKKGKNLERWEGKKGKEDLIYKQQTNGKKEKKD
jgi:hypothetical protein